jgi:hypothetical protein
MQLLVLPIVILGVLADALLHTALATDGNLAVGLALWGSRGGAGHTVSVSAHVSSYEREGHRDRVLR